jgi:hypothetical protein
MPKLHSPLDRMFLNCGMARPLLRVKRFVVASGFALVAKALAVMFATCSTASKS